MDRHEPVATAVAPVRREPAAPASARPRRVPVGLHPRPATPGLISRVTDHLAAGGALRGMASVPAVTRIRPMARTSEPVIRRVRLYWKGATTRPAKDSDKAEDVVETDDIVDPERRQRLQTLLASKKELLKSVQDGWTRADDRRVKSTPATLPELFGYGDQLTVLENTATAFTKAETEQLGAIIAKLKLPAKERPDEDEEDARTRRDTVRALYVRAMILWTKHKKDDSVKIDLQPEAVNVGIRGTDFTAGELDAYRTDIETPGVWGGLAEADRGARALGIQTDIFRVDENGTYHRVIHVGAGANNVNNWALLHRGDHYEVVAGAVDGQPFNPAHVQGQTRPIGDCLFEALMIVRNGVGVVNAPTFDDDLVTFRKNVAAALSDDQIRGSLLHILVHGEHHGLGPGTQRIVEARGSDPGAMAVKLSGVPGSKEALKEYETAYKEDPSSPRTAKALRTLKQMRAQHGSGKSKIPFVSIAADVEAGRYSYKETVKTGSDKNPSVKIRYGVAEKEFLERSDGKTLQAALDEAVDGMVLYESSSQTHSRHDYQPSSKERYNLQVQLGGTQLSFRVGKGDSSITVVVIDTLLFDDMAAEDPARWIQVLQAAHRRSFAMPGRIDIGPPAKTEEKGKGEKAKK
jgi:hypothetical protein